MNDTAKDIFENNLAIKVIDSPLVPESWIEGLFLNGFQLEFFSGYWEIIV